MELLGNLLFIVVMIGMHLEWEDSLVVAIVIVVVRGFHRKVAAVGAVLLVAAAFPPWGWPTWWCCYSPLLLVWRGSQVRKNTNVGAQSFDWSLDRDLCEALAIGFALCWLTTGFVRDAVATRGMLLQGSGCLLFGLRMLLFPIALRWLTGRPILVTGAAMTAVAVLGEWLQAYTMNGVAWSMMALCLPVAATPLAQWASFTTPLSVSALLFCCEFSLAARSTTKEVAR